MAYSSNIKLMLTTPGQGRGLHWLEEGGSRLAHAAAQGMLAT